MNNGKIEEPPLAYIGRSPLWIALMVILTLALAALQAMLFRDINPLGFIMLLPTVLVFFHTLWSLLQPFAGIYHDRVEIKPSLFYQKTIYFIDIRQAGLDKKGALILKYKDDEEERLHLPGVNQKDLPRLLSALSPSSL